jgi:hypothetical protein
MIKRGVRSPLEQEGRQRQWCCGLWAPILASRYAPLSILAPGLPLPPFSEMFRWESSAYKSLVFWFGSVSLTLLEDNTIAS